MKLGPLTQLVLATMPVISADAAEHGILDRLADIGLADRTFSHGALAYRASERGKIVLHQRLAGMAGGETP